MKSRRRTVIPEKTARTQIRIVPRREPAHPMIGQLPMSLARALTEPPLLEEEIVEEEEMRTKVQRRKAA